MYDLIIIGGGPAGITAGIYAGRQRMKTLLITKEFGGQVVKKATEICNYPGFEEISGAELIDKFVEHLKKQESVEINFAEGEKITKERDIFTVVTTENKKFSANSVIIATGADPRPLEAAGEKEFIGKGVSYCVTCLLPGEEIVANNSLRVIEEIGIGTKVLSSDGLFRDIKQIIARDFDGQAFEIKNRFFKEPVSITRGHLVLLAKLDSFSGNNFRPEKQLVWEKAENLRVGDLVAYPIISGTKDLANIKISEILGLETKNGKVKNHQETYSSIRLENSVKIDKDFLRLGGYYIAEGGLGVHHVNFYFHKKEKEYIDDVASLVKKIFGLKTLFKVEGNVGRITVSSKIMRDLFQVLFGKTAPNKKIPQWMLFLPKEKQKELIRGMFRGDGCVKYKNFELVTVSRMLAYQIRDLLLRFGIICGIDKRDKEKLNKLPSEIGGRKIRFNSDRYHIRIGGCYLEKMGEILGILHPLFKRRQRTCRYAMVDKRYAYLPITEINKKDYKGKVYNLLVDGNNTFVSKNFVVHNCDGPVFKNKIIAIIGGGNAGFEAALFMTNYAKKIYILEFGSQVSADELNQKEAKESGKIEIITNAAVKEIKGKNFVEALVYQDNATKEEKTLEVQGVFIEIGSQPATSLAKGLVDFNKRDEIIVEPETFQTKTPGLFAAGDNNSGPYKQIITAAGEGCKAALAAYDYLRTLKNKPKN